MVIGYKPYPQNGIPRHFFHNCVYIYNKIMHFIKSLPQEYEIAFAIMKDTTAEVKFLQEALNIKLIK